jgi:2-polyprenyl-6-methoxyphenol hydroxylase-like FAD-dependent oxidoreductase
MAATTVLVAGGGPAGLAAAAELALHGVDFVVVEPRARVSHRRPRAKTTSIRTMEHFRRWGIAGALREAAPLPVAWSQRVTFCSSLNGARITDFDGAFGLTTARDDRFAEAGQQVPQPVVEEVLRAHLLGQDLRLGVGVSELKQHEEHVEVQLSDGSSIDARYVLGCDGAGGVVREQIGARYVGSSHPQPNFNVVFRAPSLDTGLGPAVQYWVTGGEVSGIVGRLDLAGTWWAIFFGISPAEGEARSAELITAFAGVPVEHEVLATDQWTPRMLVADAFQDRRVFLVGESAHVNPPFGGHGFNTSVGDAVNIAWKIAAVSKGWAPESLLDSYEPERRGVVEETVASAAANTRLTGGGLPADAAAIQRGKYAEFHSLGLVLGYSYAGSPIIHRGEPSPRAPAAHRGEPSPRAPRAQPSRSSPVGDVTRYEPSAEPGARLPHCWLPDGSSLYDHLGRGFTLIGPRQVPLPRSKVPVIFAQAPPSYPWHDDYLLVRPDQHIAWQGARPAPADIEAALSAATGSTPWA